LLNCFSETSRMRVAQRHQYWRIAGQTILGTVAVALITAVLYPAHVNSGIPAFLFLLVVVTLSLSGGFPAAAVVSVVAVGCVDYFFIPPLLEWQITDPVDAVGLFTFWATSLVVTRLASNARREAENSERKRRESELLYDAASRLLTLEPEMAAGTLSLRAFRDVFSLQAACLYDGTTQSLLSEGQSLHDLGEKTHNAFLHHRDYLDPQNAVDVRCLRVAGKLIGAIGFEGGLNEMSAASGPLSLLAATAVERARSSRDTARAAAIAQTETLRSAILDAFAHEFKTPLAAMLAAAGGLRETRGLRPDQLEMAELIENESSRLGRLTTRLLRMARLDRDEVRPSMELTDLGVLITRLAKEYQGQFNDRSIILKTGREPAEVMSDPELLNLALVQLLDNAIKYSPPGTPVNVQLCPQDGLVDILVTNQAESIRPESRERLFDRFYRGPETESVTSGTGLGLYVARKIVRAHSGDLVLDRDHVPDDHTITFRMSLPIVHWEIEDAH
jgi:two-component system sensor histidine kinase KdpD